MCNAVARRSTSMSNNTFIVHTISVCCCIRTIMAWNQVSDNMNAFTTTDTKKTNVERIEVLHDTEIIINSYMHILHKANRRWDYFADVKSLSVVPLGFEAIRKGILE